MNLQALKIFRAVATERSVTRAAERLNCVQSNVSARLNELERRLNVQLFQRVGRQLQITEKGLELLGYAETVLDLVEQAVAAMSAPHKYGASLRLGIVEHAVSPKLLALLAKFYDGYPSVCVSVETSSRAKMIEALLSDALDVALVLGNPAHHALASERLFDERMVLVTRENHDAVQSSLDLDAATVFLPDDDLNLSQTLLEHWFTRSNTPALQFRRSGSPDLTLRCVAMGMGVTLLPMSYVQNHAVSKSLRCHVPPDCNWDESLNLVWRREAREQAERLAFTILARQMYDT